MRWWRRVSKAWRSSCQALTVSGQVPRWRRGVYGSLPTPRGGRRRAAPSREWPPCARWCAAHDGDERQKTAPNQSIGKIKPLFTRVHPPAPEQCVRPSLLAAWVLILLQAKFPVHPDPVRGMHCWQRSHSRNCSRRACEASVAWLFSQAASGLDLPAPMLCWLRVILERMSMVQNAEFRLLISDPA